MSKRYIDGLIDALIIVQNYANNPDWDHDACYAIYVDIEAEIAAAPTELAPQEGICAIEDAVRKDDL